MTVIFGSHRLHGEVWAVVPAGGTGQRFSNTQDKLLAPLCGIPVLLHTISALLNTPAIRGIVISAHPRQQAVYEKLIQEYVGEKFPTEKKSIVLVNGGSTRRESVYLGLCALPDTADMVAVHDAARPLANPQFIRRLIQTMLEEGWSAVIPGLPMKDTVKEVVFPVENPERKIISRTLDRTHLWVIQTPQVFRKDILIAAHRQVSQQAAVTDDAQLVELAQSAEIHLLDGLAENIKITTPQDIVVAEAFLLFL